MNFYLQLEIQIETQKARFFELHSQLGHLYERLGKNPEKDYCLIYKHGSDNINKFAIKQVKMNQKLINHISYIN